MSNVLSASFRDPSGFLFRQDGTLYRQVNQTYADKGWAGSHNHLPGCLGGCHRGADVRLYMAGWPTCPFFSGWNEPLFPDGCGHRLRFCIWLQP